MVAICFIDRVSLYIAQAGVELTTLLPLVGLGLLLYLNGSHYAATRTGLELTSLLPP